MSEKYNEDKESISMTKELLEQKSEENNSLIKAIWDMLNYCNFFVLMLDCNMIVRLANWKLATALGYENEKDIVGQHWLKFINPDQHMTIHTLHKHIVQSGAEHCEEYREITNSILTLEGKEIKVKWFNTFINHGTNMSFSLGIVLEKSNSEFDAESIRSYYKDIIQTDKTMIQALKKSVMRQNSDLIECNI